MLEYVDVLDCAANKTGEIITRYAAHRTGTWHGAFHCLIVYEREGQGYVLFQKRSMSKKIAPGKFDVSVGGHYASGEDAATAGPREIKEELGLDIKFKDLYPIGRRIFVHGQRRGIVEHEFQDVFLLLRPLVPHTLTLQQEELDGVIEMGVKEGIKLFSQKELQTPCLFYENRGASNSILSVSADDFVFCIDNYYLKLLLLTQRFLHGAHDPLVI
ncbi:MAG TPA: NUDIX domain-containing protein [Nitrospirota bacterium]|nr:NUDIX domain-containing protein [Nitrospirota bacterium]